MSFSDVEHFGAILSGCESIGKNINNDESRYAFAVLKLHAQDAGCVAGQEGFIETVKKGAQKTVDWIIKLIKSIRDWLSAAWKKSVRWVKFSGNSDFVELAKTGTNAQVSNIESFLKTTHTEKVVSDLKDHNVKLKVDQTAVTANAITTELNKSGKLDEGRILRNFDVIMDNLKADIETLNAAALTLSKSEDTDTKLAGQDAAYLSQSLSRHLNGLLLSQEKIAAKLAASKPSEEDKK